MCKRAERNDNNHEMECVGCWLPKNKIIYAYVPLLLAGGG